MILPKVRFQGDMMEKMELAKKSDRLGILSIGVAVLGLILFDLSFFIFPLGVLLSLRSNRGGSKWGLAGLVLNGIGVLVVYGSILLAFMIPFFVGSGN